MKKFTVKDFILYNGPCFSCGRKTVSKICCADKNDIIDIPQILSIKDGVLEATLRVKYSFTLSLKIHVATNKFVASNDDRFARYLGARDLLFTSNCKTCRNFIMSNELEFNSNGFIKALSIKRELLSVYEGDKIYNLMTEFEEDKTNASVWSENASSPISFELPLLPLYKFKTREKLIKKLNTYVLFS